MVEEMTKTVVIKSPVTVDLEYNDNGQLKVHRQDPEFGAIFFGDPQGKNGIHQLGFGYIFFADKPLMATNLPPYYHNNGYTEADGSVQVYVRCSKRNLMQHVLASTKVIR